MKHLILLIAIVPQTYLYAYNQISLDENTCFLSLTKDVDVFENKNNEYSFDDVIKPELSAKFKPNENENLKFGCTQSVFWVRFSIKKYNAVSKRFLFRNWEFSIR